MNIRTRHIHSVLFLISRALLLCIFVPTWRNMRSFVLLLLSVSAFHQILLYLRRFFRVDERTFAAKASRRRILQSTGPVGKLIAAFHVYFWEFSSHPHPINLLHWLEVSICGISSAESTKFLLAYNMQLLYVWDSNLMALCMKNISTSGLWLVDDRVTYFRDIVSKLCEKSLVSKTLDSIAIALRKSPSVVIFLFWLAFGRRSISSLQTEPKELAYHMDSIATHTNRLLGIQNMRPVNPEAFGIDMRKFFEPGVSRKIYVRELQDAESRDRLQTELMKHRPMLTKPASSNESIDHESIFCISYRHLEDKNDEGLSLLMALQVAARLAKVKGYDYFRVWMDKILRQCEHVDSERWAFYGLLPYSYYCVIAVRHTAQDEGERMWLLAEERLAYGNMGLYVINLTSEGPSIDIIRGLSSGPENSIRVYLRYLRTEESTEEKTFHIQDKQRFQQLADRHGKADDEDEMYQQLCTDTPPKSDPHADLIWWPGVLDVESYSALRKREVEVDVIDFMRAENVPFDGYREWFKWREERFYPIGADKSRPFEVNLLQHCESVTAYECTTELHCGIMLLYRGNTGLLLDKAACIFLLAEKTDKGFRILKRFRIRLRYDKRPSDDDYLQVVIRMLEARENEDGRTVKINPADLYFL